MSDFKGKLAKGQKIYGTMLSEVAMPNIVKIFKVCGFDFFIIDCEHGYFDYSGVAGLAAVARGVGLPTIVRIPKIDRECILKYLELGADGLLVPMVASAADVERVVEYAKYAPLGSRGVSTMRAHTGYDGSNMAAYIRQANDDTIIIAQIESSAGLTNIEKIAAVNGLDGLVAGPNDLSMDLGLLGQYQHPQVQAAISLVAAAAGAAGRWSGIISSNKQLLGQGLALGMQFVSWNSEVGMIAESAKAALAALRAETGENSGQRLR